jgi:predicted lipid-binding transport protein (Tim44 family)
LEIFVNKLVKPSFLALLTVFFTLFSVAQVAEAKRFGGGSSFGYSKSVAPKSFNTAPKAAPKAAPTTGSRSATPARAGMMGMMGGLLAGGLLASLFMGDGFEGIQLMDILLMALVAFGLMKLFSFYMRQKQGQTPSAYTSEYQQDNYRPTETSDSSAYQREARPETPAYHPNADGSIFGSDLEGGMGQGVSDDAHHLTEAPTWFNAEEFVEGAKGHFASLQKAWDDADLAEMESYCSPELFAALQQEMAGMQAGDNHTVIDTLNAELADMAIDGDYFIASIRFTGFIQEDATEGAHAFNEIWHIRRLANDEGTWQVAGIQQNAVPL